MKKNILCLLVGLLTIAFTACEPKTIGVTIDEKNITNPTEKFFPEPCMEWWISSSQVKAKMTSLGYKLIDESEDYCYFYTHGHYVLCLFEYDEYVIAQVTLDEDANIEQSILEFKTIATNYSLSSDFTTAKEGYGGLGDNDYCIMLTNKDKNTYVFIDASFLIAYGPMSHHYYNDYFETIK